MKLFKLLLILAALLPYSSFGVGTSMVLKPSVAVSCTTGGVSVVAKNSRRIYLLIVNNGTGTVYLKADAIPSTANGIPLATGQSIVYEQSSPINGYYCISPSGSQDLRVQEGF